MTVESINSITNSTATKGADPVEWMNIILISKREVGFTSPPPPKTKKAQDKKQAKAIKFIRDKGFDILTDPDDEGEMLLDVGESRAIGIFQSVYEVEYYVRKGYPAIDIARHEAEFECFEDANDPTVH